MSFASLGLSAELVRAVTERGYTEPTPIQAQAIPVILKGGDLMGGAQTGTGKTAGFTLPLLQRLMANPVTGKSHIRALVLTPTRELAAQVEESVRIYGKYLPLKSMMMFGGVNINPQIKQLHGRVDILVATPGRLLDHMQQKTVDLSHVEILVLDEADRMLDMGFIRDIKKVLAVLPKKRQNLLFSATFSDEIKLLADGLLNNPALIEVARRNATAELIEQRVYPVDRERKRELLTHLIKEHNWFQVLVFTRTKHGANRLAEQLDKDGIPAMAIHGNKSQAARTRALAEFKTAKLQVLVATDIAARGIDVDGITHVVNYDLPNIPESYVHRIGRTARAGRDGVAISFCDHEENGFLRDIERTIRIKIPSEDKRTGRSASRAGGEPAPHHHANGRNGGGNRRGGNGQNRGRNGGHGGQGHGHSGQGHGEQRPQRAKGHGNGGHQNGHRNGSRPAAVAGGHGGGEDIGGMKFMQRGPNRPRSHAPR